MAHVQWSIKTQVIVNCSCSSLCPCETIGWPGPNTFCEGVWGMNIIEGHFGDVSLDGLKWAGSFHAPGALHEGNVEQQLYIDRRANDAQQNALIQILTGKVGCPLFEILGVMTTTFHETQFVPIEFEFDKERRRARVASAGLCATVSEPLLVPATGGEQRLQVREPEGFMFKEAEAANAVFMWAGGKVKVKHKNTHSFLFEAEYTPEGVKHWSSQ
ncbi:MAG: DUF1326 domain-containing protein [Candidatus Tectomicrobia bacterium]|nr:DUF1326 domain-containing protein [Candidatus Tectomicrobia bacterium]